MDRCDGEEIRGLIYESLFDLVRLVFLFNQEFEERFDVSIEL